MILETVEKKGDANKPPILFLHGAWHGAWCWNPWLEFFNAQGHTVVAPSYRGHANSPGRERLRFTALSEFVEDACVVASTLEKPIVIGHSLGGAVAQRVLERIDAKAGVLVASCPATGALGASLRLAGRHPLEFAKTTLKLSLFELVNTPELVRDLLFSKDTLDAVILETMPKLQDESFLAFLGLIAFRANPSKVKAPVLVIGGKYDGIFSNAEIQATAKAYNAPCHLLPGGHDVMFDFSAEKASKLIFDWISKL